MKKTELKTVGRCLLVGHNLVLSTLIFFTLQSARAADKPTPVTSPETSLEEKKTATELPTKRKLPTAQTIDVRRKESDQQIEARLNRIAHSQDVFAKVHVDATEGVVTVKGEVEEETYAKSFTALCEKVEGVIGVVDQLKVTNIKKTGLRLAQSEVHDLSRKFFKFLPYLASCFVILALTFLLGYGLYRIWLFFLLRRLDRKPLVAKNLAKLFALPVYLLGFYLILEIGGLGGLAATLVGGTGMLGIILGLAGKNIIENVLSSFMLTLRNPFKLGDQVVIGGESGVVHRIDSRCTMLMNSDGVFTQIPNSTVLAAVIKNISAHPLNRVVFSLKIDRNLELPYISEIFKNSMKENSAEVAADPKPEVIITEIAGSEAQIECIFWVDRQKKSLARVRSNVLESLVYHLDEHRLSGTEDSGEAQKIRTRLEARKSTLNPRNSPETNSRPEQDILEERSREVRSND